MILLEARWSDQEIGLLHTLLDEWRYDIFGAGSESAEVEAYRVLVAK